MPSVFVVACLYWLTCSPASSQTTKYALLGGTTVFNTDILQLPDEILWKHNKDTKVVEFDGMEEVLYESFKNRVILDWHSAVLTIRDLKYEDSGLYELEVVTNNKLETKSYNLEVMDKVTKPTISCEMINASASALKCSSPSLHRQSLLTFKWSSDTSMDQGQELKIPLGVENDDRTYHCTVSNPLTQDSAVFLAKDCYPVASSQVGLIAGVVVFIIIFFIVCLLAWICFRKGSKHDKSDIENTKGAVSENGEGVALLNAPANLDRAPTMPSKQTLGHLKQIFDDAQFDPPRKDFESKIQDSEIPCPSPAPEKPPRTFSECHTKENGKDKESESSYVGKETVQEDHRSDSEETKPVAVSSEHKTDKDKYKSASHPPLVPKKSDEVQRFTALLKVNNENAQPNATKQQKTEDPSNSASPNEVFEDLKAEDAEVSDSPPASPRPDHLCADYKKQVDKDEHSKNVEGGGHPVDSEETKEALTKVPEDASPENNKEDNGASHPPDVSRISDQISSEGQKATDGNALAKKAVLNNSADSENPNELSAANDGQNPEKTKDENESAKPSSENDVQQALVAKENSRGSPNSPKASPKDEHKQDGSLEDAVGESEEESNGASEKPEKEERGLPAVTPKLAGEQHKVPD